MLSRPVDFALPGSTRGMETVLIAFENLRRLGRTAGPYLLIEAVMPGGTLLALLLYLYRRRKAL